MSEHENAIPTYEDILEAQKVTFQDVIDHATGPVISFIAHVIIIALCGSIVMIDGKNEKTDIEVQIEEVDITEIEEPPEIPETEITESETDVEVEVDAPDVEAPEVDAEDMDVEDVSEEIEMPTVMKTNNSALVLPGVLGMRSGGNRMRMIKKYNTGKGRGRGGASAAQIELATTRGLDWLANHQNEDGSWGAIYKPGMTSLAMLALFAHGETPMSEKYGEGILKGVKYLCSISKGGAIENAINRPGLSGKGLNEFGQQEYTNAMVAYALSEGYVLTKIPAMKEAMDKQIEYLLKNMAECGGYAIDYDNTKHRVVKHSQAERNAIESWKDIYRSTDEYKEKQKNKKAKNAKNAKNKNKKSKGAGMHALQLRGGGGGSGKHPGVHWEDDHPDRDRYLWECAYKKWKSETDVPAELVALRAAHTCEGPYIAWVNGGISAWHFQALKAAYVADCQVEGLAEAIDQAITFSKENAYMGNGQFGFNVVDPNLSVNEETAAPNKLKTKEYPMTNAGVLTLQLLGEGDSQEAKDGLRFIEQYANGAYLKTDWPSIGKVIDDFEKKNEAHNKSLAAWQAKKLAWEAKNEGKKGNYGRKKPPKAGGKNSEKEGLSFDNCIWSLYTWYYQTQVLFQANKGKNIGSWKTWNSNMTKCLVKEQNWDTNRPEKERGFWTSPTFKYSKYAVAGETSKTLYRAGVGKVFGIFEDKTAATTDELVASNRENDFGYKNPEASLDLKTYSTAMCTLQLTVYYRYLPTYKLDDDKAIAGGMKSINDDLGLSID